jgi:transcriptional regulator with XRE-family HTH domain
MGHRLREARKKRGWSLSQLSAETRDVLSKSRISNYEQGTRRPGVEQAEVLALALGTVSASYLLDLDEEGFVTEEERALLVRYRETDERGRATIRLVAGSDETQR